MTPEIEAELKKIRETFQEFVLRLDSFMVGAATAFMEILRSRKGGGSA